MTKLNDALGKLPTPPTKGADEACGDQQCYVVTLKVTSGDLQSRAERRRRRRRDG